MKSGRLCARRPGLSRRNEPADLLGRAAAGAVGGLAGTVVLQLLRGASQKWLPSTVPQVREDPGEFMVEKAEQFMPQRVQERIGGSKLEHAAAKSLGLGYGMTFGALYGLLRPEPESPVAEGAALGLGCWAAGYLGWLPASGLMEPVWRQDPAEAIAPAIRHALYGVTTAAVYDALRDYLA